MPLTHILRSFYYRYNIIEKHNRKRAEDIENYENKQIQRTSNGYSIQIDWFYQMISFIDKRV